MPAWLVHPCTCSEEAQASSSPHHFSSHSSSCPRPFLLLSSSCPPPSLLGGETLSLSISPGPWAREPGSNQALEPCYHIILLSSACPPPCLLLSDSLFPPPFLLQPSSLPPPSLLPSSAVPPPSDWLLAGCWLGSGCLVWLVCCFFSWLHGLRVDL